MEKVLRWISFLLKSVTYFDGWYDADGVKYLTADGACMRTWDKTENAVLYARWYVKSFEIQINDNGSITWLGANGFSESYCTIEYGAIISSINLIATFKQSAHGFKDGRIFDHFEYDNDILDWTSVPDLGENGAVITVTPVWILERHTIYFNALCDIVLQEIVADYESDISLPNVARNDYIFEGWYDSNAFNNRITWLKMPDLTPDEQSNGSATLFAKYSLKSCAITYDLDGGKNASGNPNAINIENAQSLAAPSKTGYKFDGWYLDAAKTQIYTTEMNIWRQHDNVTLYAKWSPIVYKVSYLPNGGTGYMTDSSHTYDVASNLSKVGYEKSGYSFAGWSTVVNGNVIYADNAKVVNLTSIENKTIELYACWRANGYTVKYDANGGRGSMSVSDFTYDVENKLSKNAFSKTGHRFLGWSTVKNGAVVYTDNQKVKNLTVEPNGSVVLYAKWTPKTYTILIDNCGGSGNDSITATYGAKLPTVSAPTKSHSVFNGYYTSPNGAGTQYSSSNGNLAVGSRNWDIDNSDVKLYAYWTKQMYNVTLHTQGDNGYYDRVIQVAWGDSMPIFQKAAPVLTGYAFVGYFAQSNGVGTKYYGMQVLREEYPNSGVGVLYYEHLISTKTWTGESDITIYSYFQPLECYYTYDCLVEVDGNADIKQSATVHLVHGMNTITAPTIDGCTFKHFYIDGRYETSSPATWNVGLKRSTGDGSIVPEHQFWAVYTQNSCIARGTLITLADGSQIAVEKLTGNERLLVWNLQTGKFDTARILFVDRVSAKKQEVINLTFSDGTQVRVVSEHAFWDINLNKYVYLRSDAAQYIGHWFIKQGMGVDGMIGSQVQLVSVTLTEEFIEVFSPITYGHFCYFVNGMLSMPGGIEGLINIFEVDADTMMINKEAMAKDIAQYGLFTFEEFSELFSVSREVFDAFNGQYLKVAIGKGLTTVEHLQFLVKLYADYLV